MKEFYFLYILCLLSSSLSAQIYSQLPALEVVEKQYFDNSVGLPRLCVDDLFMDSKGRIWITTCDQSETEFDFRIMQFDGYGYDALEFPVREDIGTHYWGIEGQVGNTIYGFKNAKLDVPELFLLNPDQRSTRFVQLAEGNDHVIISITEQDENNLLVLMQNNLGFQSVGYALDQDSLYDRKSYSAPSQIPETHQKYVDSKVVDNKLWLSTNFSNRSYFLDLEERILREAQLPDLSTRNLEPIKTNNKNALVLYRDTLFQFSQALDQSILKFNKSQDSWQQDPTKSRFGLAQSLSVDLEGNMVVMFHSSEDGYFAVLFDKDGNEFDYSGVLKNVKEPTSIVSRNFKEYCLIATKQGIVSAKLKNLPKGFLAHNIKGSARGGVELSSGDILFTKNRSWLKFEKDGLNYEEIYPEILGSNMPDNIAASRNLFYGDDSLIWVSSNGIGTYDHQANQIQVLIDEMVIFIAQLKNGDLVYLNKYLMTYDMDSKTKTAFQIDGIPVAFPPSPQDLIVTSDGRIWVATSDGIWVVNFSTNTLEILSYQDGFSDPRFLSLLESSDGRIWCGTVFDGVQIYDPATKEVKIINKRSGLSNNTVATITQDTEGDFWVATFDGLNLLNKDGKVIGQFDEKNGLPSSEFDRSANLLTKDGTIWLGTFLGPIRLDPSKIKANFFNKPKPQIYLTKLGYFDESQDRRVLINTNPSEALRLQASQRYLSVDFSLSSYTGTNENQFAYKLEPDQDWTYIANQRSLNLNNLPIGKYRLYIKGADYQGNWSEPLSLQLNVKNFFYRQPWFYAIVLGIVGLGGFFWINRLRTESRRLSKLVQKRTSLIRKDKETIEHQAAELRKLDQAKSDFFTNIAHELRTPLTVIGGMVSQINKDPERWSSKGLALIDRNNNNLLKLVNQILDLRKLESGEMALEVNSGDVIQYLKVINESFASLAESKNITMHYHSDEEELWMNYDGDKLMKVVSNLLSNAIKFSSKEGNVYFTVSKVDSKGIDRLSISVRDTGIGISNDQHEKVFKRFTQVRSLATKGKQGTGIGLTLTSEIVKLMGGEISLKSKEGSGSTFTVLLPINQTNAQQLEAEDIKLEQVQEEENKALTIAKSIVDEQDENLPLLLICEDNPDVATYILSCVSDKYRTMLAYDGAKGIELAFEETPDLIISDVMMPEKDGYELTDTLKNDVRTSHIPIVLLTARADIKSRLEGLRRGADVYLSKPFNPEELDVRLEKLLEVRNMLRSRYKDFNDIEASDEPVFAQEDAFILQLKESILNKIDDEQFGIPEICKTMGVSRTNLHNKLKSLTGKSTSHFIRQIRLNRAIDLMRNPNLNISEIAYDVGFGTLKYFSNVFKEEFGVSPTKYRKAMKS